MSLVKVKNQIMKFAKSGMSKEDMAIVILNYYHLHISPSKPVGSEMSVNSISKAFNLKISEETTIAINKLLFISTVMGPSYYLNMIAERFCEIHLNELKK